MTDNEIVKALECCIPQHDARYCEECPIGKGVCDGKWCDTTLLENALDLINRTKEKEKHYRQKVQNQRETINALQDKINRQKAKIERLGENNKAIMQTIADVHTEAVKEFAERVKAKITMCPKNFVSITSVDIDNLVKEMVGDDQ